MHIQILVPNQGEIVLLRSDEASKFVHYKSPQDSPLRKQVVYELLEALQISDEQPDQVCIYMERGGSKTRALNLGKREADKLLHPENYTEEEELKRLRAQIAALEAKQSARAKGSAPPATPPAK